MEDLTWRCEVCGAVRPDAAISVARHDIGVPRGAEPGVMMRNVKHCNDRSECVTAAHEPCHWVKWPPSKD